MDRKKRADTSYDSEIESEYWKWKWVGCFDFEWFIE